VIIEKLFDIEKIRIIISSMLQRANKISFQTIHSSTETLQKCDCWSLSFPISHIIVQATKAINSLKPQIKIITILDCSPFKEIVERSVQKEAKARFMMAQIEKAVIGGAYNHAVFAVYKILKKKFKQRIWSLFGGK
jgi:hypothetical protein